MNSKIIIQLLVVALIIINTSCGDSLKKKWEYHVDNPLDTEIVIKIDEAEYKIPALTTQTISLTQGKHTLTYNGSSVNFVTKVNSNKSVTLMNPTLSNYMLHSHFYISDNARNKNIDLMYEESFVDYQSDEGIVSIPVTVLNTLFIDRAHNPWTYFIDQNVKDEISTQAPGTKHTLHKLYREAEYKKEFAGELPAGIVFPANPKMKLSEQPVYKFRADAFLCDCEEYNTFVKELEDRWNKMIADPSNIRQDIGGLGYDVSMAHFNMKKPCTTDFNPGKDDSAYKEALNRLSSEMTYLSNASSIIVD